MSVNSYEQLFPRDSSLSDLKESLRWYLALPGFTSDRMITAESFILKKATKGHAYFFTHKGVHFIYPPLQETAVQAIIVLNSKAVRNSIEGSDLWSNIVINSTFEIIDIFRISSPISTK